MKLVVENRFWVAFRWLSVSIQIQMLFGVILKVTSMRISFLLPILLFIQLPILAQTSTEGKELEEQKRIAEYVKKESDRQRYLSVASKAARASLEILDRETAALVALQAYNFNSKNAGDFYDSDIHLALLNALERYDLLPKSLNGDKALVKILGTFGTYICAFDKSGQIFTWNQSANWQAEKLGIIPEFNETSLVEISFEGKHLAVVPKRNDGIVLIYKLDKTIGKPISTFRIASKVNQILFRPGSSELFILLEGGKELIRSTEKLTKIKLNAKVSQLSFSGDGELLAGLGGDTISIWDASSFALKARGPTKREAPITSFAVFNDYSQRVITGHSNGVWNVFFPGKPLYSNSMVTQKDTIFEIKFSSELHRIATVGKNSVRIWDAHRLSSKPISIIVNGMINGISFSPDNQFLLVLTDSIQIYPLQLQELANPLCSRITRNITFDEWDYFLGGGEGIKYERTCPAYPFNNK